MKHDLLVLLLLFFGVPGVAQTSGSANEKQYKHRFPEMQKNDRFFSNRFNDRHLSTFTQKIHFGSVNEVVFNTENTDTDMVDTFKYGVFQENVQFKTTFYNY